MIPFNVINFNFNAKRFEEYDVMPYLINSYNEEVELSKNNPDEHKVPVTFEEFKEFVRSKSQYQFWARCEYEIVLVDWPCGKTTDKWDVHDQIMMNLDIVSVILMNNIESES